MNEGRAYRGTSRFSPALKTRFGATIDLGYLPEDRERKMLVQRTGINPEIAAKLCSAARQLRASEARGDIQTPISTRSLIACCDGIMHGAPIKMAITLSIVNQVEGTNPTERKAVADVMEVHFGKEVK
jgi:MoxR-like ATPase